MKQELLIDFLQISETLKLGKKHHKKKGKQKKDNTHSDSETTLNTENISAENDMKKVTPKMSFATRTTLWLLLKNGSLNQRSIAKTMNISAQAVSEIIKKLLEKELINKESGDLNNENIITLTDEGKVVAQRVDRKMKILSENIFKDFTEEEMDSFTHLLLKIQKNKDEFFNEESEVAKIE